MVTRGALVLLVVMVDVVEGAVLVLLVVLDFKLILFLLMVLEVLEGLVNHSHLLAHQILDQLYLLQPNHMLAQLVCMEVVEVDHVMPIVESLQITDLQADLVEVALELGLVMPWELQQLVMVEVEEEMNWKV